jgi:AraC-like DNA-binding protein
LYLLLQSITLLEYVLYWTNLIYSAHVFAELSLLFPLTYGPLLWIYFNTTFGNEQQFKKYWMHFIPFAVLLILKIPFYASSPKFKFFHTHNILFGEYFHYYYPWLKILHLTVYVVLLYADINHQSGVGFMRAWARWITGFFASYVFLTLLYQVLVELQWLTADLDYFISLSTTATIFFIAWYGRSFPTVADGMGIFDSLKASPQPSLVSKNEMIIETSNKDASGKYVNSGLPKSLEIKLAQDLERLMREDRLYKQNDLKLETLAEKLITSKHFVSQVINEVHQVNFFEYINLKRIEEAKQLLRTNTKKDLNIIEVAFEVGFNNKGTFNSVFKKITGLTPTEFRKQSKQLLEPRSN